MCCESFGGVIFDLQPLLQGQMGSLTFEVDFSHLLLVLEVWDVDPTDRKSCAASLLQGLFFTSDPPHGQMGSLTFEVGLLAYYCF